MRWIVCALLAIGLSAAASAADLGVPPAPELNVLRGAQYVGPIVSAPWAGFYGGGTFSFSDASADFSRATGPLVSASLAQTILEGDVRPSDWQILGNGHKSGVSGWGAFAGYNTQWEDLVLGIEADYTHSPASIVSATSPVLDRVVSAGQYVYSVNLQGTGALRITDYGSLRARWGWVLGNFLPYGFAGVAFGRADYAVTSLIFGQQNLASAPSPQLPCVGGVASCVNYSFSNSSARDNVLLYGFSVGGGLDVALTPNIFVRGEFEFIQFAQIHNITATITSGRLGAGFKF